MHDKKNLYQGLSAMARKSLCPWDDYYPRMAQSDFFLQRHNLTASKTYFIRKAPFEGSYAILGGITEFQRLLAEYKFSIDVGDILHGQGYREDFIKYLIERKTVNVTVNALPEGSLMFGGEPAVVLEGSLLDVRIAEGMLLECVNYPSLAMTKWRRVVNATEVGSVMEFARRRAQDCLRTTLYSYLAGATISSNSEIRSWFDIPTVGTMGHEWIQSFGNEFKAFDLWLQCNPGRPVLLVDTVDTLSSGIPNAIKAFSKNIDEIRRSKGTMGIRLDGGDLAYLAMEGYRMLQSAGLQDVKIYMTNDLDEYSIQAIREQISDNAARFGYKPDEILKNLVWACGTKPGTCWDQPSIGGVAKLTSVQAGYVERSVIKLARDNPVKTSIPGSNRSAALVDKDGFLQGILIYGKEENLKEIHKFVHQDDGNKSTEIESHWNVQPRQTQNKGYLMDTLEDVRARVRSQIAMLHWTQKRIDKPHTVKVGLSPNLFEKRQNMINQCILID
jgi:nicotinate phosphoribosyltransferase